MSNKIQHKKKILETRKSKGDIEDILKYIPRFPVDLELSLKFDGASVSYQDGKFISKGNRVEGRDITSLINKNVKNIPEMNKNTNSVFELVAFDIPGFIVARAVAVNAICERTTDDKYLHEDNFHNLKLIKLYNVEFDNLINPCVDDKYKIKLEKRPESQEELNIIIKELTDKIILSNIPTDGFVFSWKTFDVSKTNYHNNFLALKTFAIEKVKLTKKQTFERRTKTAVIGYFETIYVFNTSFKKALLHPDKLDDTGYVYLLFMFGSAPIHITEEEFYKRDTSILNLKRYQYHPLKHF